MPRPWLDVAVEPRTDAGPIREGTVFSSSVRSDLAPFRNLPLLERRATIGKTGRARVRCPANARISLRVRSTTAAGWGWFETGDDCGPPRLIEVGKRVPGHLVLDVAGGEMVGLVSSSLSAPTILGDLRSDTHRRPDRLHVRMGGSAQSIGFAIPVDRVRRAVETMKKGEAVKRGYLGVFGKPPAPDSMAGAHVARVVPSSPAEKAGILKRRVPALSVEQAPEVEAVLREAAEKLAIPLRIVNKDIEFSYRFGASENLGPHTRVCLLTDSSQFMHLPVPLPGEHQALNCGLALAAIDALKGSGFSFPEVPMHEGLARTTTPGRMELVWQQPRILIDGAHNPAAIRALMRCVGAYVPYDSMICIFGCCEDKDIPAMLDRLALGGDKVIFTRARGTPA